MGNMNEALSLLVVGMVMVFFILSLVVVLGNVVVRFTNRFLPEVQKSDGRSAITKSANPKKLAAIAAVVDHITQGEGRVDSVQKNK